jgi:peptidoglycan/xylan/chitin deacetylase (PgdA/CDA1 family)
MRYSLMFHHFHGGTHLKTQGSISADDFCEALDFLTANFNLINPETYRVKLEHNTLLPSDVCLTFDDALKCQFDIAFPELERRNLKAFFFIYSGAFTGEFGSLEFYRDFRNSYFDTVEEFYDVFFKTIKSSRPLKYDDFSRRYPEDWLSDFPFYTENDKKFRFMRDIILEGEGYCDLMEELLANSGYSKSDRRHLLFMSTQDVRWMSDQGHTIGLHSHSHPTRMQDLSREEQVIEYEKNRHFIQGVIQDKVWSMSHPCGQYNEETLHILSQMGVEVGFRSSLNTLSIKSSLEIPREDHTNFLKAMRGKNEDNSIYQQSATTPEPV